MPIVQLVGAVLFTFGSACFVWQSWVDDWLLPMRIGCAAWIGGAMPYFLPPLRNEYYGEGSHLSNALQVGGMLGWAIGSSFAFLDDLDTGLPVTNGGFMAGSACLLVDALLQARHLRSGAATPRNEKISIVADLLAGMFYVLAGAFGGYATEVGLLRFGNVCWLVGSLFSFARPCLALSEASRTAGSTRSQDLKPSFDSGGVQLTNVRSVAVDVVS